MENTVLTFAFLRKILWGVELGHKDVSRRVCRGRESDNLGGEGTHVEVGHGTSLEGRSDVASVCPSAQGQGGPRVAEISLSAQGQGASGSRDKRVCAGIRCLG